MLKKPFKAIVALFSVLVLVLPMVTKADGMMVVPPNYWMREDTQKAVVFYDKGVESLILSITFQGNANDFGWIVPTPTKPTVTKGSDEIFTNLQKLTSTRSDYPVSAFDLGFSGSEKQTSGVSVIETKQVDYYDVTILTATDKDALTKWFADNKYNYPESASYILNTYIQNNWYFVAMKINPQSLEWSNVTSSLRTGHATPVVMQFATENIVYPLKISTVVSQANTNTNANANSNTNTPVIVYDASNFTFGPGKFGKAINISGSKNLSYTAGTEFPYNSGTIEAQINIQPWESGGYRNILSVGDSKGSNVFQLRLAKAYSSDTTANPEETIQFVWYKSTGSSLIWRTTASTPVTPNTWHHVAVTWTSGQKPQIYLDGVAMATSAAYNATTWLGQSISNGSFQVIGSRLGKYEYLNGYLDEYIVRNQAITATEIAEDAKTVMPTNPTVSAKYDSNVVYYANFDDNIKLEDAAGVEYSQKAVVIVQPKTITLPDYYSKSQYITLYVIANERKDATGFSTTYANWFSKKSLEDLAFSSTGSPLLAVSGKKMFVTVMNRTISSGQNLDDVFFRTASSQSLLGTAPDYTENGTLAFWIFLGAVSLISIVLILILILWNRRTVAPPTSPLPKL
ncbi:MAG: DUF2330 domain-containing protein [Patescibacteria group bacterium]|jgi:hypothetical protein